MNTAVHNKLVSFIWSIADDCLRDVYVRGKYRDVILPMVVLRRLDALLEPTKDAVMAELKFQREEAGFTELDEKGLQEEAFLIVVLTRLSLIIPFNVLNYAYGVTSVTARTHLVATTLGMLRSPPSW